MTEEERIRRLVRRVVYRTVGRSTAATAGSKSRLVTEDMIKEMPAGGALSLEDGALVTPLARQAAMEKGIRLSSGALGETPVEAGAERAVAVGADHGGYPLKELLKEHIEELGYPVVDCGTGSTESVDYPDFALAVARLVGEGAVWRGILVDGAGIGSAMAANKVPGVRAAICYDEATAVNSREHNDANVLTLGAGLIGVSLARQIVETWLKTPFGGGRHGRRVEKIMEIEARYSRGRGSR